MALPTHLAHNGYTNPAHPTVYQISTRPYLYARGLKKISEIPKAELQELADRGVHAVWFMGVWSLGEYGLEHDRKLDFSQVLPGYTKEDVIGSPYAITEYKINPELGAYEDLLALRETLHSMNMGLMLDFVPNHSAVDSPWFEENQKFYITASEGCSDCTVVNGTWVYFGGDFYNKGWTDTLQLNYWNPDLRKHQVDNLLHIASVADYIRCDMAMDVLNDEIERTWGAQLSSLGYSRPGTEFWKDAISEVKSKYPGTQFLGESYNYYFTPEPEDIMLAKNGFDYMYDKGVLDNIKNQDDKNALRGYIASKSSEFFGKACHFVENHDDNRAAGEVLGSIPLANIGAIVASTLPGMRLFFDGQWDGLHNKLDVHLRRGADESKHADVNAFYANLTKIIADPIFQNGQWTNLGVSGNDASSLLAWRWSYKDEHLLVVANPYSAGSGGGSVVVADAPDTDVELTDLLTGAKFERSGPTLKTTGLYVIIDKLSAQIFSY